jgi:5'-3' exonuclease
MRLHLVDGTYELFRAHFSKRPDQTDPRGRDVKATAGVASSILALLEDPDEQVTHIAVAFDNPVRSFRNELYAGYKTEEGVPAELLAQFDRVEEATRAIGVVVWSMDRWEADDALATGAARWGAEVDQVRILTPDKDLGQCIRGERVVQVDRMRKKVVDQAGLLAVRGVLPESIPDYLALVGDTADGIPGIKGFGEKTAAALLREYVHLEQIPPYARDWKVNVRGAAALAPLLAASRDEVLLYRTLATLVTDVPLPESLDDLRWRGVPRAAYGAWCDELGLSDAMRSRPARYRDGDLR